MTRRDQELLDRQLRGLRLPPRRNGTMMLAIVAVFLAGIGLGSLRSEAGETAHLNTAETALALSSGSDQIPVVLR
jgi:hypothetical protein